ncbi:MAG TPA: AAA family ATPase [Patescibacteria group bacterium]|nr:AAA family ATPase [Patescibacteria group bacterium]
MKQIIAIVGPLASGKGALITLLEKKGYSVLSLSGEVREKTNLWGLDQTRENLQNVGDKLRKSFGPAILAELIGQKISPHQKFVIDGIRNPAELSYLQKTFHAFTIAITATPEKRFEMMKKRGRVGDPTTWEEFKKAEERDRGIGQESFGQQVEACVKMADVVLDNNGTYEQFEQNLTYFLPKIIEE